MHLLTLNSEMTKDNLPLKTKLAFGIGSTGEAATNWVFSGLVFFYYNQIIGLPGTLTGIGVFIAMMFDAISDPWWDQSQIGLNQSTEEGIRSCFLLQYLHPLP